MMRTPRENPGVELADVRAKLASASGPEYWRSLEEAAGTEAFQEFVHREFPEQASELSDPNSRRDFLKVMGASLALAGVSGCAIRTPEKIAPWVKAPENVVPGRPQFFASSMAMGGLSTGILVESHSGRPTKIEGNPDHPASLGSTDVFMQSATLALYDPDRSKVVLHIGQVGTWDDLLAALTNEMDRLRPKKGAGLRILTEAIGSPSLVAQIKELLGAFPEAKWHSYEPANKDAARAGARLAFGEAVDPVYRLDRADVILALDADFLACGAPGRACDERAFAARRDPKAETMNRLYAAEAQHTSTGASADHRLALKPSQVVELALRIAKEIGVEGSPEAAGLDDAQVKFAVAVAKDLKAHKGKGLVLVGDSQPAYAHALGHAINQALGNIGPEGTVAFIDPIEPNPVDHVASLRELVADANGGKVEALVILGGNPVYNAPVDLDFAAALKKIPLSIRLGMHDDETSQASTWHVPEAHFLESWGDGRAFDGTASLVQPMISPLYDGRTAHDLLSAMMGQFDRSTLRVVQEYWRGQMADKAGNFDLFWRTALTTGVVAGSTAKPKSVTAKGVGSFGPRPAAVAAEAVEIQFRPDPTIWDGRFANNGWLQELPKPITKTVWDNAALVGFTMAERLRLKGDQVVELKYKGRTLKVPVFVVPGQADNTVILHLGYGRTRAGMIGTGPGFDAFRLLTADAPAGGPGLEIAPTAEKYVVVTTQAQRNVEGRDHIRTVSLADFIKNPNFAHGHEEHAEDSLTPLYEYDSYAWGMAIDLNSCTGCNACVISCVAENNSPVIGKAQMAAGRNMQWMEIDTYFHGTAVEPDAYFQPRTCMHCENAPCELVCPVAATVHDAEGLNVMVYNRCVGTRYCGNNCPYKVRHFNYFTYADLATPEMKLRNNPDVTVRSRGVMEKCTYCVQRISGARIAAKEEGRRIKDGEVRTACQAACPAQAIHFGDINDKNSKVAKIKAEQRNYAMLGELNVRPRTTYLGKIRNSNPELSEA